MDVAVDLLHEFKHGEYKLYVRRATKDDQSSHNSLQSTLYYQSDHKDNDDAHSQNHNKNDELSNKQDKKQISSKPKPTDEVQRIVESLSVSEKKEILKQMRKLIDQNEEGAKQILLDNPQLAQALLFIQIEFNLVNSSDIQTLTKSVNNRRAQPITQQQVTQSLQPQQQLNNNQNENSDQHRNDNNGFRHLSHKQLYAIGKVKQMTASVLSQPILIANVMGLLLTINIVCLYRKYERHKAFILSTYYNQT